MIWWMGMDVRGGEVMNEMVRPKRREGAKAHVTDITVPYMSSYEKEIRGKRTHQ